MTAWPEQACTLHDKNDKAWGRQSEFIQGGGARIAALHKAGRDHGDVKITLLQEPANDAVKSP